MLVGRRASPRSSSLSSSTAPFRPTPGSRSGGPGWRQDFPSATLLASRAACCCSEVEEGRTSCLATPAAGASRRVGIAPMRPLSPRPTQSLPTAVVDDDNASRQQLIKGRDGARLLTPPLTLLDPHGRPRHRLQDARRPRAQQPARPVRGRPAPRPGRPRPSPAPWRQGRRLARRAFGRPPDETLGGHHGPVAARRPAGLVPE